MPSSKKPFALIARDGYTEREAFEGETLEEIWQKLGEKIGEED